MESVMREGAAAPRVLLVDDEQHLLKTMSLALQASGYEVHAFSRPQEALDAAEPGRFHLALVDLKMQPLGGIEVLQHLRRRTPTTTVIIITAHGTVESAVEAMKQGAYYYLQKPFELKELQLLAQQKHYWIDNIAYCR
jgi:DNA-binding NtrC family response regulator